RLCCALSVRQYGAQATAPHRSHDRTAGHSHAAGASRLGQAAHRRRTRQSQQLGSDRQPQYGQAYPDRCSLVDAARGAEKGGFTTVTRTAEEGGQTVNVDLCFVPAVHTPDQKLPAVSGSSGRLVVERLQDLSAARSWPGQVFADLDQPYATAMQAYV